MLKKVKPIQQKLVVLLSAAILILCTFFLPISYGKTSRQTSFNTDLRQSSVDLKSDSSSDSQNTHVDSHKDFDVESWMEKSKDFPVLNRGIFSRFDVTGAALYAQNDEQTVTITSSCDPNATSTPCTLIKESNLGDKDKDKD